MGKTTTAGTSLLGIAATPDELLCSLSMSRYADHFSTEGVAETFGKPLFQITCGKQEGLRRRFTLVLLEYCVGTSNLTLDLGDLGSTPKAVELALQTNFALANRWGCILLLDEADVFLAERRREDFNRNGMVAGKLN